MEEHDENALQFLDSVDSYLLIVESLGSILRQGWLELASARHSMGALRVNSALLDLKHHSAATTLELHYHDGDTRKSPQFTLRKWASVDNKDLEKKILEDEQLKDSQRNSDNMENSWGSNGSETNTSTQETNGSETNISPQESSRSTNTSPRKPDSPLQKERVKLLSMFGTLVSPKLRASQLSFEAALETLVEIANIRSSIIEAHNRVQKEMNSTRG